jgi:hypothetical protein
MTRTPAFAAGGRGRPNPATGSLFAPGGSPAWSASRPFRNNPPLAPLRGYRRPDPGPRVTLAIPRRLG